MFTNTFSRHHTTDNTSSFINSINENDSTYIEKRK